MKFTKKYTLDSLASAHDRQCEADYNIGGLGCRILDAQYFKIKVNVR